MKRKIKKSYVIIAVTLLALLSISQPAVNALRGKTAAAIAPLWILTTSHGSLDQQKMLQLEARDALLLERVQNLTARLSDKQMEDHFPATIYATVIYRSPAAWDNSLWINVGERDNQDHMVVMKNSPVLDGSSVVGVIDYVGRSQSRVRLITDSGLTTSVRALRGDLQKQFFAYELARMIEKIERCNDFLDQTEKEQTITKLHELHQSLSLDGERLFLAKGELSGLAAPRLRKMQKILKGTHFNYEFKDDYGPARDLRTGIPYDAKDKVAAPLIRIGDLLVTTGMDGVFPPGLDVATVTKVHMLKEGDYFFEIEARPTSAELEHLAGVLVIPPIGYDESDIPPVIPW